VRYAKSKVRPPQAVFKVPPSMTKHEVKEYLTKIYQLPVQRVMTANFAGRWRRHIGETKMVGYKQPRFKKAFVTFEMGARIQ
jgi:large subunit ribosomal protein L23